MHGARCILLCFVAVISARAQNFSISEYADTATTQGQHIQQHLSRYITPEYEKRVDVLRSYQRDGYANILMRVLDRDLLHALIDYWKMRFTIDYSLNRGPIYYPSQTVTSFELPFDWRFPDDPWKKEQWRK